MPRRYTLVIAAVAGGLIAAAGWRVVAQTPTPISACGNVSGNVILVQDISTTNSDCLTVTSSNTTINGNNKIITINDAGHAIFAYEKSGLNVRNLNSNSDIYLNGENADNAVIEDNHLEGVNIVAADDVIIRRNTLGFAVLGQEDTSAERITFTDNVVRGSGGKLVAIRGTGIPPCPASHHVISNNTFISDHVCTPGIDCDEPMILFIWCVSHSTFSHNTMTAASKSQGIRLRDESDNNSFTNNTVWVHDPDGDFGALNITSGNADKHHPRLNTFSNNLFRSDTDLALNMQSPGDGNTFDHNIFWSNTGVIANMMNDGSNNNTWDHNTFFNAGSAPALLFDYRNNRPTDNFTNNIVATSGATAVQVTSGVGWDFARYAGNYNLFWSANATATFLPYGALAGWNSAATPDDDNSLFGNPRFTNSAAGLFTIQAISPARSAGSNGSDIGALGVDTGPANCSEAWSCGEWSTCLNGIQTRTCIDANICGTTASRPATSQSCSDAGGPDLTPPGAIVNLQS